MKLSSLHSDVVAAINLVPRFVRERFDMLHCWHSCGTPSCAAGNLHDLDSDLMHRITNAIGHRGTGEWGQLFGGDLCRTIKTPEQWRDHAIAWLAKEGVDYHQVMAGLETLEPEEKVIGAVAELVNAPQIVAPTWSTGNSCETSDSVSLPEGTGNAGSNPASPTLIYDELMERMKEKA